MPFKAYYLTPKGELQRDLNEGEVSVAYQSKQGLLWVDVTDTTEVDGRFLEQTFGFHHLAVEDCVSPRIHPPKIDDFGEQLFIIVHGINHLAESDLVETMELELFLGPHYVVSNHNYPMLSVDSIHRLVDGDGRPLGHGPDFLAYALVDALTDNVLPTIDRMGETADAVEEEALNGARRATPEAIFRLKRSAQRLHRILIPQGEIMNRLSRGEFRFVRREAQIYYRDVFDHITRLEYLCLTLQERADIALSIYLSAVANRQNEAMKVLSVVATIFLPLMLLASIYGMNFENMPELRWRWGYFVVVGFMGAVALSAVAWFWARSWFTWGRRQVRRMQPFAVEKEKLREYVAQLTKWPRQQ